MSYRLWLYWLLCSIGIFGGMVNLTHAAPDPQQVTPLRYELLLDEEARYYHVLPGSAEQWQVIGAEFVKLYGLTTEYFVNLSNAITTAVSQSTIWQLLIGGIFLLLWWSLTYGITWLAQKVREHQLLTIEIQSTFIGYLLFYLAQLWLRNVWLLILIGSAAWCLIYLQIPNLTLLFSLFGVLIAAKFIVDIARMVLYENFSDHAGHDVRLYQALKWGIIFSGLLTALTVLAHLMPISVYMTGFIDPLIFINFTNSIYFAFKKLAYHSYTLTTLCSTSLLAASSEHRKCLNSFSIDVYRYYWFSRLCSISLPYWCR